MGQPLGTRDRLGGLGTVLRAAGARRDVRVLKRLALIAVVVYVAVNSKSLFGQLGSVGRPAPAWLGAAVAAEAASLLAYALLVRALLRLGGVTAPIPGLLGPTLAGIAMGASLPGGVGASNVYWYRQLRRYGADGGLAALTLTGTSAAGALSLFVLLVIGVAIAGDAGPTAGAHTWLLVIGVGALVLRLAFARRFSRLLRTTMHRIAPSVSLRHVAGSPGLPTVMVCAYTNWLLDCGALYASLQALHAPVPARGVIVVYALSQLVANVALIPGGGGTVELALAAGFSAFGPHSTSLLAGVLLYRLVNCWGLIPVGWVAVLLNRGGRGSLAVGAHAGA